jgi:hypothetical protein
MRTTIRLDLHLLRQLKQLALESHTTVTSLIEDAVRGLIARRRAIQAARPSVHLPTFGGQGLQPGVDLDDTASLLDKMDGR